MTFSRIRESTSKINRFRSRRVMFILLLKACTDFRPFKGSRSMQLSKTGRMVWALCSLSALNAVVGLYGDNKGGMLLEPQTADQALPRQQDLRLVCLQETLLG